MARKYRMTPRRRAALKKAQAASARKRRGRTISNIGKGALAIGGAIGTTFVAYHTQDIIAHPNKGVKYAGQGARATRSAYRYATFSAGKGARTAAYAGHRAKIAARPKPKPTNWSKLGYL